MFIIIGQLGIGKNIFVVSHSSLQETDPYRQIENQTQVKHLKNMKMIGLLLQIHLEFSCTAQVVKLLKTITETCPPESGASKSFSYESFLNNL